MIYKMYVGGYSSSIGSIYEVHFNSVSNDLKIVSINDESLNPIHILNKDNILFSANEIEEVARVSSFRINDDGSLKLINRLDGEGNGTCDITVSDDEIEACNCGSYGCLEQYTSATGIVRVTKRKLAKSNEETTLRKYENLTAKDVFDEAKAGDAVALDLVDEVCGILGKALSNIACVVDPEVIVIGGGVSKAGDILIETIQKHFVETAFHACRETVFSLAGLGNDAGMYGCVKMLLD